VNDGTEAGATAATTTTTGGRTRLRPTPAAQKGAATPSPHREKEGVVAVLVPVTAAAM